jgi:DNA-binding CsgD family transcriptional regulator
VQGLRRILYISFILFFTCVIPTQAQEIPPIQNFSPEDYGAESQNWGVSQAENRHLYFANDNGLLEYNGENWRLYPSPNGSIIRSVKVIGNRVYTGCHSEFGYWEKNAFDQLVYHSLSNTISDRLAEDEQFWNILEIDDYIIFQSLIRLYIHDQNNDSYQIIDSHASVPKSYKLDNLLYYQAGGDGIYRIVNGQSELVTGDPVVQEQLVIDLFIVGDDLILLTQEEGFYRLSNGRLLPWNIPANEEIRSQSIYSSFRLSDGSFALGSISNGLYLLNDTGAVEKNINQEKGLVNNTVLSVGVDVDRNIWLGLDNGISVINYDSPISTYNDVKGMLGRVYTSAVHNEILYLGTNQGLFQRALSDTGEFSFVPGTEGQVWCLRIHDDTLFCGHNEGTFLVEGDRAIPLPTEMGTWDVKRVPGREDLLIQGNYSGFVVLQKIDGRWTNRPLLTGFNISARFFEFVSDRQVIVNHEYKGVYLLSLSEDLDEITNIQLLYEAPKGLRSSIVRYGDRILYALRDGVFEYNAESQTFELDTLLTSNLFRTDPFISGKLIVDPATNSLWGFTEKSISRITPGNLNAVPVTTYIPMPASTRGFFAGYENLYNLGDQRFLFGSTGGYIVVDMKKLEDRDFSVRLGPIENYRLNEPGVLVSKLANQSFKSRQNNFNFSFSVADYRVFNEVQYRYRLDGLYTDWSPWSTESTVSMTNLRYGDYTFRVKARIGDFESTNEEVYSFSIERPWLISNLMITIYALLAVAAFIAVHLFYRRYYNRQKQSIIRKKQREMALSKLESDKIIMQLKNENLKTEVSSKSRELAAVTLSMIKKNELLSEIKQKLTENKDEPDIKSVVKIINNNISKKSDWKFFQKAFNNADRNFLKKIKELHPVLTPNDLRLCAYLRLNLSSKEIAPLLNISSRSVEIKRYRLRKKMELEHEKGLVEYILSI